MAWWELFSLVFQDLQDGAGLPRVPGGAACPPQPSPGGGQPIEFPQESSGSCPQQPATWLAQMSTPSRHPLVQNASVTHRSLRRLGIGHRSLQTACRVSPARDTDTGSNPFPETRTAASVGPVAHKLTYFF